MKPQNLIHVLMLTVCLAFSPKVQAVSPPPDGGYPGGNMAEGHNALLNLTTGGFNTAVGWFSLETLTSGLFNTAVGAGTLVFNTGDENTATGTGALLFNTSGNGNTANGVDALFYNTQGHSNTAIGFFALLNNGTGNDNTAVGVDALVNNVDGTSNTAIGFEALDATTGSGNTAVGNLAGGSLTGDGNVCIGDGVTGFAGESNHTYIRNIDTTPVSGGNSDAVTIDLNTGLLGHLSSSRRYKENVKPMDNASEALYRLKPVTYRYKKEIDRTQSLDYGLVAEDVANVDPNLTIRDRKGQIESVRYTAVNAMLLNEFLKEHRKVEQQEATIAELKKGMETLVARCKEQDAKIKKVSDQIEMKSSTTRVAVSNP
ncbi:MAG: tail fiber domain-containing protein [Limisphaerales bacterium]